MTDFEKNVRLSARNFDSLVQSIDQTNDEMLTVVRQTNQDLDDLEAEREKYSSAAVPGEKLHSMIETWAEEQVYTSEDIK